MSSDEMGRARRKPKRRDRMEGSRRRPKRHQMGAERRPRPPAKKWSQSMRLGDNIEIRAKAPYRAASLEVKPGLFVVGELRSDALEFGASALDVTKSLLTAASKGVDALSSKSKGSSAKKTSSKSRDKARSRRLAEYQQRDLALRIREAKVQRAEDRLKRCYAAMLMSDSGGAPLKREAVPWMGDEDLVGADAYEEPYSLQRIMWELHKDDE